MVYLQECWGEVHNCPCYSKLLNMSIQVENIGWKSSLVMSIPKKDDHCNLSKYCPISPLPVLSIVLGHRMSILFITIHLLEHIPISTKQWSFLRKVKKPINNVLEMTHFEQFPSSFQKVGVWLWYTAHHGKHHPIFWYRSYTQNVEQIQVFRQAWVPNSSKCCFQDWANKCHR